MTPHRSGYQQRRPDPANGRRKIIGLPEARPARQREARLFVGAQFDRAVSDHEVCKAISQCKRGVSYKSGPMNWYIHRMSRAVDLQGKILSGKYKLRPGKPVQIYKPKRREAIAPWFQDRVWQQSMCNNGVYDDLTGHLIYDNAACQTGKGTEQAIRRTIQMLQGIYRDTGSNEGFGVHLDVRKYFPSTPQAQIIEMDQMLISEPMFLPYLEEQVHSVKDPRTPEEIAADPFGPRGTGLGSRINQLHQVTLLDETDRKIKALTRGYQRYNDDFLILSPEREICEKAREIVRTDLEARGLECVDKSGVFRLKDGFYFLRKRFILTDTGKVIVLLHRQAMAEERKILRHLKQEVDAGRCTMDYVRLHYQCVIAQYAYVTGDGARRAMDEFYTRTFREKPQYKLRRKYLHGYHQKHNGPPERGGKGKQAAPGGTGEVQGDDRVHRHLE